MNLKPKDHLKIKKANTLSELTYAKRMLNLMNPFESHSKM